MAGMARPCFHPPASVGSTPGQTQSPAFGQRFDISGGVEAITSLSGDRPTFDLQVVHLGSNIQAMDLRS